MNCGRNAHDARPRPRFLSLACETKIRQVLDKKKAILARSTGWLARSAGKVGWQGRLAGFAQDNQEERAHKRTRKEKKNERTSAHKADAGIQTALSE